MNRYKITGVQLGMLIALEDKEKRKELVEEIINNSEMENTTKRFVVQDDYIVDTKTGLVWEKDMFKRSEMSWNDAMNIKGNMRVPTKEEWRTLANTEVYPKKEELRTLTNTEVYPTKEELEAIGFINVKYWYWTADEYDSSDAFLVSLGHGDSGVNDKTRDNYVVCVM